MIRGEGLEVHRSWPGKSSRCSLCGVNLSVAAGRVGLILGRSGAGKTTLLETMAGLVASSPGTVRFSSAAGQWRWGLGELAPREARRRMGFLFQYPERQLFGATPLEDVEWGAMPRCDGAAERALEAVGLPPQLWATSLRRLSRGEKRRVALAGLLIREPEVLFLDEPAVGLDPEGQALLWQEVEAYRHGRGAAVLVATHWPEPWLRCAANVLCLEAGVVLFSGPVVALPEAARRNRAIAALLPVTWRLRLELEGGGAPPGAPPEWVAAAKRWLAARAWSAR